MENRETPKPGTEDYPVNHPEKLNQPKFNSVGRKDDKDDFPPVENMNDQQSEDNTKPEDHAPQKDTNLGNPRDDEEDDRERIIRR